MEDILLMPQQAKFFSKRADRKNAFDIIVAFNTDPSFDVTRFDDEVNQALRLSKVGYLRMSEKPYLTDTLAVYQTTVLDDAEPADGALRDIVDALYRRAIGEIDVSAGRFMLGYLSGTRLFLVFNHLVFDLEGVYCLFDELSHLLHHQPVNCSANPNELVRLIEKTADSFTDAEIESPWAGKDIVNFMVEMACPDPLESDMTVSERIELLNAVHRADIETNLVSTTNGKNKGLVYLVYGALLAANHRVSGSDALFGHFNHSYSAIPRFTQFSNVITWKVAGVPWVFNGYARGDEADVRTYLGRIKREMDVLFNEGYKIDVLRQRKSNPGLLQQLDSPIMLLNFRTELGKLEAKVRESGLEMIEGGYEFLPHLFGYPARHLFDLNLDNHADGLFLTVEYCSRSYTEGFVRDFARIFREECHALADQCGTPVFAG